MKKLPIGALVTSLVTAAAMSAGTTPAHAAVVFTFSSSGSVGVSNPACPDPTAGCSLTATGVATALSGNVSPLPGPWNLTSIFSLVAPTGPGVFDTAGTFTLDDPSAADNDLFGLVLGSFDFSTLTNNARYVVTGGSGLFAGANGSGTSLISVAPTLDSFSERGQFTIAEPATAGLAAMAVLGLFGAARRLRFTDRRMAEPT